MDVSWNGVPLNHPFVDGFSSMTHTFGGTPILGNSQMLESTSTLSDLSASCGGSKNGCGRAGCGSCKCNCRYDWWCLGNDKGASVGGSGWVRVQSALKMESWRVEMQLDCFTPKRWLIIYAGENTRGMPHQKLFDLLELSILVTNCVSKCWHHQLLIMSLLLWSLLTSIASLVLLWVCCWSRLLPPKTRGHDRDVNTGYGDCWWQGSEHE